MSTVMDPILRGWARYKWTTGSRVHYWQTMPVHPKYQQSACGHFALTGRLERADLPRCANCERKVRQ